MKYLVSIIMVLMMVNLFAVADPKPEVVDPDKVNKGGVGNVTTDDLNRKMPTDGAYKRATGAGKPRTTATGVLEDCDKYNRGDCAPKPNKTVFRQKPSVAQSSKPTAAPPAAIGPADENK